MYKLGEKFYVPIKGSLYNLTMTIEIMRFVPNGSDKAEILFAVWSPGRRRNYKRIATKVKGTEKVYRFKFEGNIIEFERF